MKKKDDKFVILAVDDDPYVLESVSLLLKGYGYSVEQCSNAEEALALLHYNIDVVLTDVKMPNISGIELLERIHSSNADLPVILMTGYAELDIAIDAIKKGAFDFITKPYNSRHLIHSIEKAIKFGSLLRAEKHYKAMLEDTVKKRTEELSDALAMVKSVSTEIIQRLINIAEFRDTETGAHIARIGLYANKLAEELNLSEDFVETIAFAGPMHDIGKVGIPDNILLKPGSLTSDEFKTMKNHTLIGGKVLAGSTHPSIQMAASIAITHHERWDGKGYPSGLKGDEIPLEGRIIMIADQYDALRSNRPYRNGLSHEKTYAIITEGDGRTMPEHFDPKVLNAFVRLAPTFDEIFNIS